MKTQYQCPVCLYRHPNHESAVDCCEPDIQIIYTCECGFTFRAKWEADAHEVKCDVAEAAKDRALMAQLEAAGQLTLEGTKP